MVAVSEYAAGIIHLDIVKAGMWIGATVTQVDSDGWSVHGPAFIPVVSGRKHQPCSGNTRIQPQQAVLECDSGSQYIEVRIEYARVLCREIYLTIFEDH